MRGGEELGFIFSVFKAHSTYEQKKTNQQQLDLAREATNYQAGVAAEEVKLLQAQIDAIKKPQTVSSTSPTIAGIKLDTKTILMVLVGGYFLLRKR